MCSSRFHIENLNVSLDGSSSADGSARVSRIHFTGRGRMSILQVKFMDRMAAVLEIYIFYWEICERGK